MIFDLTEDEKLALAAELKRTIDGDRYPFSARIVTLKAILDKIEPQPVREPCPPLKVYAPPRPPSIRRRRSGRQPGSGSNLKSSGAERAESVDDPHLSFRKG